MSITLRADNRILFKDAPYGAIVDNYSSASSSVVINTTDGFEMNDFIVIGALGTGNAELLQLKSVDHTTGELDFFGWGDKAAVNTDDTHLHLPNVRPVMVGQTITAYVGNTAVVRGTNVIAANQQSNTIILSGAGITGLVPGDVIEVNDITKYAHSEASRVTRVPYNGVQFFYTLGPQVPNPVPSVQVSTYQNSFVTDTKTSILTSPPTTTYTKPDDPTYVETVDFTPKIEFDNAQALCNPLPIQVTGIYSVFQDNNHLDGFGWFAFYNSYTKTYSPLSSYIPYGGFEDNSVKAIFESFDSSLNNKELKLITMSDRFLWLNEAYSYAVNELSLGNWEFKSSENLIMNIKAGISDYLLPKDFGSVLNIDDPQGRKIENYEATFPKDIFRSDMRYRLRGRYLVFFPIPQADSSVTFTYLRVANHLSQLSDTVELPARIHLFLKDYMSFRAYRKLGNLSESTNSLALFTKQLDNMKIYANKRDDARDSWSIGRSQTV